MDVKYTWILGQGKKFRHFWLANVEPIYWSWSFRSYKRRGGNGVKVFEEDNRYINQRY